MHTGYRAAMVPPQARRRPGCPIMTTRLARAALLLLPAALTRSAEPARPRHGAGTPDPSLQARCEAADLSESALRHCGRIAASRDGVTLAALKRGGWLCRASLVLQSTHHKIGSSDHHDAIDGACGFDPKTFTPREPEGSKSFVTVAVHHNGLGNQLFQYAMGRLLAWSLGSDFAAVLVDAREGPMNEKMPPHSAQSWDAFKEIFDKSALGARRHAYDTCAELTPTKGEYLGNGTLLLAERPADTRRVRLAKQLEALLLKTADGSLGCVKTIGYFQQYAFFAGRETGATFPTSKAPLSVAFHSFRLIFGRAIISRSALDARMLFLERARAEHSRRSDVESPVSRPGSSRACRRCSGRG